MKIIKTKPSQYNAIQFDLGFVKKYGLIKYPMIERQVHALYPVGKKWVEAPKIYITDDSWTMVSGRPLVRYINYNNGQVVIADGDGFKIVDAPWDKTKTDWEKHHFWFIPYERKVTRPVYNFDSPELDEFEYRYYLDNTQVNDKDWIVTDSEGKSEVFSPDEFEQNFVKKSGDQDE